MRILLVSEDIPYPNMGGLAKHVLNLARALVRQGHQTDLLGQDRNSLDVCGEEGRFGGRFFGELNGQHAGWKEIDFGMFMPPKRPSIARHFARIILRHAPDYDVIHYHGHIPNVALHIPETVNFVQTRHDQGADCFRHTRFNDDGVCESISPADCAACVTARPNRMQRMVSAAAVRRFRREVAEGFRRHKTVFVSDMLARNFARSMGEEPWGATVHNFADRAQLESARAAAAALPRSSMFQVFIAAKLYPAKGVEQFLRAFAPLLRPDIQLTIAGDGPDEARLRAEFESAQIRFLGWCAPARTIELAAASDAVVVPSVWEEPCATTVLEGLFLGKPTFALARGGTPELAIYASPHQLRLYADMEALARDLAVQEAGIRFEPAPDGAGGAEQAVRKLLHIYQSPRHTVIS
jgi:glycogen synthase